MARHLFISDLHLSDDRAETVRAFEAFVGGPAQGATSLYILGDLFEYWAGDDDDTPLTRQVADALRQLAHRGTQVFFMAGNRDFLLGADYAARGGFSLLPDPSPITLDGRRILLTHGDTLCTDDHAYQAFRQQVRDPRWQADFLARPLAERRAMIEQVRRHSISAKQDKSAAIMDVNGAAVAALLRDHHHPVLIHGHTHRPARHVHVVDEVRCERWVLADWDDEARYLAWCDGKIEAHRYRATG